MIRYVVIPGYIISRQDSQRHYVTALDLIRLYLVDPRECRVFRPDISWSVVRHQHEAEACRGLIRLVPKRDGDYTLPTETGVPNYD